jgi:hypothetical protein
MKPMKGYSCYNISFHLCSFELDDETQSLPESPGFIERATTTVNVQTIDWVLNTPLHAYPIRWNIGGDGRSPRSITRFVQQWKLHRFSSSDQMTSEKRHVYVSRLRQTSSRTIHCETIRMPVGSVRLHWRVEAGSAAPFGTLSIR